MKKYFYILLFCLSTIFYSNVYASVPIYVWMGWNGNTTEESLTTEFTNLKNRGVVGVCLNAGFNLQNIKTAAKAAKKAGLIYHAWIPCMLQGGCDPSWYAVNRLGEPANKVQAYVSYYQCLDPHNPQVQKFLIDKYSEVANIPEVDYIQLDYIRYVDVILAKGLWKKYNLVMNEEYPTADYCYCDDCVADFKAKTGIDIKAMKDPSKCKKWSQFRCNVITDFVNKLTDAIHAKGKKVSADVFPGPYGYAVKMVRQEWCKWKIDAFFPMNYNDFYLEGAPWVGKITRKEVKSLHGSAPLYSGLFICHDWRNKASIVDPEGQGLTPTEMETAVKGAMKAGAAGLCLFTSGSMTNEHWDVLNKTLESLNK
jgi:hypothetical protein